MCGVAKLHLFSFFTTRCRKQLMLINDVENSIGRVAHIIIFL